MNSKTIIITGVNQSNNAFSQLVLEFNLKNIIYINGQKYKNSTPKSLPSEIISDWQNNLINALNVADENGRVILVLYSFAAPMLKLIEDKISIKFHKIIMLAPMLELKRPILLLLNSISKLPNAINCLKIKSKNTSGHRRKKYCTISEYRAVYQAYQKFHFLKRRDLDTNVLIIIDSKDEFISTNKIKTKYMNCNILIIHTDKFHHQLLRKQDLQQMKQQKIIKQIKKFIDG